MDYLLDNRLSPITRSFGMVETETNDLVDCFMSWQYEINEGKRRSGRSRFKMNQVSGSLEEVLLNLLPLGVHADRYLFLPTKSNWTAFFENHFRGTDPSPIHYLARRCNCRTIWIVATSFIMKKQESRGFEGALILEFSGPEDTGTTNLNVFRSIRLEKDIGKWSFTLTGTPFPFETLDMYEKRNKKDRFTPEMMNAYLLQLGIDAFHEEFYLPPGTKATLIREIPKYKIRHLSIYEAIHYYDKK
jgi:hypothetical protein